MNRLITNVSALSLLLITFACETQDQEVAMSVEPVDNSPIFMDLRSSANARSVQKKYAALYAEFFTTGESKQIGRTVYFNDVGNKRLSADFVPGLSLDSTDNISFYIDETRPSEDLSVDATSAAIRRAMQTWDDVNCSDLGLYEVPFNENIATGFVSAALGFGGGMEYVADIVHAGWLPAAFFDEVAPSGSNYILGATFTIVFTDDNGDPTDVDNNKKADVAWREAYYNDAFTWRIGNHYDVETIALHESGHGLSQAHFGKAFADAGSGKLHFAPRAVMNAAYSGIQTSIDAADNAGHCSNWASWNSK